MDRRCPFDRWMELFEQRAHRRIGLVDHHARRTRGERAFQIRAHQERAGSRRAYQGRVPPERQEPELPRLGLVEGCHPA